MNFTLSISRNHLKALSLFSGRKDARYWINGINIDAKNKAMQATDGRRALRLNYLDVVDGGVFSATIPILLIDTALKAKSNKLDGFKITIEADKVTISIGGQSFTDNLVDAALYPDVNRVLPQSNSNDADASCHFNPDYLSDALKACKLIYPYITYYCTPLKQSAGQAAYYYRDDAQMVVMPMRETHKG